MSTAAPATSLIALVVRPERLHERPVGELRVALH